MTPPHTPNDIEFAIRYHLRRYRKRIIAVALFVVLLVALGTLFYSVDTNSKGLVLRFGRLERTSQPGLHAKLPWPVESVEVVPVLKVETLEFGYSTAEAGVVTRYAAPTEEQEAVARLLTGDLNLAHVEWVVQYRIKDPEEYLFRIGGEGGARLAVENLIRDASESVMRRLVGDRSVDEVITRDRDIIANEAATQIQQMLDRYHSGVHVVTVRLQSATPPEPVKDAFDAVNRARQNKERVINDAEGERNRLIPARRGSRDQAISEAEGYRERVVREMTGRANAFLSQLAEYEKAPEITKSRLYLEAMEEILSQVESKTVIDESVKGLLPLLNLDAGAVGPAHTDRKGDGQ